MNECGNDRSHPTVCALVDYSRRRAIATGLMDLASFTTNAHELKKFIKSYAASDSTYDFVFIIIIILTMVLQVMIGSILLFAYNLEQNDNQLKRVINANDAITYATFVVLLLNLLISA